MPGGGDVDPPVIQPDETSDPRHDAVNVPWRMRGVTISFLDKNFRRLYGLPLRSRVRYGGYVCVPLLCIFWDYLKERGHPRVLLRNI
jgi:hypothetical protein